MHLPEQHYLEEAVNNKADLKAGEEGNVASFSM